MSNYMFCNNDFREYMLRDYTGWNFSEVLRKYVSTIIVLQAKQLDYNLCDINLKPET